eukprot:CAMPEP_0198645046 /NCGR_PEP_ID=MMETSP1467-20131203/1012_1 /TAXON_ID=1462469 /ORGANISM="unid. sp., Strain CCMP2135" /LENGTH=281 /DNA_ID=CAMNT_0044380525 /DNA_START=26 /DNA_END=871 /DNA_ORIENTATION=+
MARGLSRLLVLLAAWVCAGRGQSWAKRRSPPRLSDRAMSGVVDLSRGGGRHNKAPADETPPQQTRGVITRAVGWTAAETAVLYGALVWAAATRDARLELTLIVVVVFGSSAVAEALLAAANAALSVPLRQILIPTRVPDQTFYDSLPKPQWNPPTWVFPVAWLLVSKPTQVLALNRLKAGKLNMAARLAYVFHLALGDTWNRVFFGERHVGLGVVVIGLFVSSLALAAGLFARLDRRAALFLLPTLAWVSVAAALNLRIWQLLQAKDADTTKQQRNNKKRR